MHDMELRAHRDGRERLLQQTHLYGVIFHEEHGCRVAGKSLHPCVLLTTRSPSPLPHSCAEREMRGHLLLLWVRGQEEGQLQEAFLLNSTGEIYTSCRIFSTGLLYPHD